MARDRPIELSNLTRGKNRFTKEAGRNQYVEGQNVIGIGGDTGRRDAFIPVGSGAPHMLPGGAVKVVASSAADGASAFTNWDMHTGDISAARYIYVGVQTTDQAPWGQFAGIDLRDVNADLTGVAAHYEIQPQYWNGTAWVDVPSFVDETRDLADGDYFVPLARNGRIYWHLSLFTALWAKVTINSVTTTYWIRLIFRTVVGQTPSLSPAATQEVLSPGIRVFNFAPVNGLFSTRVQGKATLMIGSDRPSRVVTHPAQLSVADDHQSTWCSGLDMGAGLGAKEHHALETRELILLDDESPGVFGAQNWVRPLRNGVAIGSAGLTFGAADVFTKTRQQVFDGANNRMIDYEWRDNMFRGGVLSLSLTPIAVFADTTVETTTSPSGLKAVSGFYRHARIQCTARVGAGPAVGEHREVFNHTYNSGTGRHVFSVWPAWTAAPDANNRFIVYGQGARLRVAGSRMEFEALSNQEHTFTPLTEDEGVSSEPTDLTPTNPLMLYIGRALRWLFDAGESWSGTIDPITGYFLCTNGRGPTLEWDGYNVRRLRADYTSPVALAITGQLPDTAGDEQRPIAKSVLRREPPRGRYIAIHRQRVFIVGTEPLRVHWSEPQGANNIWPLVYEDIVRDADQDPITGMISWNDRLILWTPTAIHEAVDIGGPPWFTFQQVARGIGFVGPNAACVVTGVDGSSRLVGIAPDGLYAYASGEPSVVLDDFSRIIEGGVNADALHRSSAVYASQQSIALFAVPPRGSSRCTRIIVWDAVRDVFHEWTAPFGIASMAVDTNELGRERILFGTDDGYVMTLGDAVTDDGTPIESFAVSPFVQTPDAREWAIVKAHAHCRTTGATAAHQMELDLHVNGDAETPLEEQLFTPEKGAPYWDSPAIATYADVGRPQKRSFETIEINATAEARGHSFAYRVGGACRWVLRSLSLMVVPLARRGR